MMDWTRTSRIVRILVWVLLLRGGATAGERPNFVIILADDQGWNATSHRANPELPGSGSKWFETPNLDQLAREGFRFSRAYSPGPTCSPSRHAIQWGRSPSHLKIFGADHITKESIAAKLGDALANTLKRAHPDYVCAHFGKWHVAYETAELGFAINDGSAGNKNKSDNPTTDPKFIFSLTKKANGFLEKQAKSGKPFLLQISHYADHLRYEALPATVEKYQKRQNEATEYHNDPVWAAMNENLDTGIGMVLKKIDELGLRNNTYIIYTADNGYERKTDGGRPIAERKYYKAYPQRSHKYTVSEGGIRVPFIVRGPGIPANLHSEAQVTGADIFPTIMDMAGLSAETPKTVEGVSLLNHMKSGGKTSLKRQNPFLVFKHSKPAFPFDATIVQGDFKYIRSLPGGQRYLFNLRDDIGESKDLKDKLPEKARALDKALMDYLRRCGWSKKDIVEKPKAKQARENKGYKIIWKD